MASGGVFNLICNDGKADRMIMATKLLNTRIKDIMVARKMAGKADFTPTLVDLERTHILYMNSHFKPFAAIGFEYNKVRPQSGSIQPGGSMIFSIPQFGDFFYDMVCHVSLPAISGSAVAFPTAGFNVTPYEYTTRSNGTGFYEQVGTQLNALIAPVMTALTGGLIVQNQYTPPTSGTMIGASTPTGPIMYGYISYSWVDPFGTLIPSYPAGSTAGIPGMPIASIQNFIRYCEYPGQFLFNLVKFDVNGNPLDQYDKTATCMLEKFTVSPNKRIGYDRLMGQEIPMLGYSSLQASTVIDTEFLAGATTGGGVGPWNKGQSNTTVSLFTTAAQAVQSKLASIGRSNTTNLNATIGAPTSVTGSQTDISRQLLSFVNGPQTPKPIQPPLELWIPLTFWFNTDVRLAIPSVSIPFGQRFITIDMADFQSNSGGALVTEHAGAYLRRVFEYDSTQTGKSPNTRLVNYAPYTGESAHLNAGQTASQYPPTNWPGVSFPGTSSIVNIPLTSSMTAELYINNIFVNPEIHDIYIKRIGFSLIRVFRQQTTSISGGALSDILLSQLKWPIEYMYVGLQPTWNTNTGQNPNVWRDWHRFTRQLTASTNSTMQSNNYSESLVYQTGHGGATGGTGGQGSTGGAVITGYGYADKPNVFIGQFVQPDTYYPSVSTIDSMSLISHGISIFDNFSDIFYNAYLPYNYGGPLLNTPYDQGVCFINFALFPGVYQPSGHLNISRARETYVNPLSAYVGIAGGKVNFFAVAVAINFLLITDGSAVLRYST